MSSSKPATEPPAADTYILKRDFLASARLTYQHDLYVSRQGYMLHPSITSRLASLHTTTSPIQILDLATGNGVWPIDLSTTLSQSLPNLPTQIIALDISSTQFPPKALWPSNITFDTWDFLTHVPEPYLAKFDIIHIRFVLAAFLGSNEKRDRVIGNISLMLKPNGYLQWQEVPPPTFGRVSLPSLNISTEWEPAFTLLDKVFPIPLISLSAWTNDMPSIFTAAGFVDTHAYYPPARADKLRQEGDLLMWNLSEAEQGIMKMVQDEKKRKEVADALQKLFEEIRTGEKVLASRLVVCVARKPID